MYVQIVKFKIKPDTSREAFLDITKQMIAYLESLDGFVSYELYEGPEYWSDRIAWTTESHAQEGLNSFRTTAIAKQITSLLEADFENFFGETIISA